MGKLIAFSMAGLLTLVPIVGADSPSVAETARIRRLIKQLDGLSFHDREEAASALAKHPLAGAELFRAQDEANSPELRARLQTILAARAKVEPRVGPDAIASLLKERRFDRLISTIIVNRHRLSHEHVRLWQAATKELVADIVRITGKPVEVRFPDWLDRPNAPLRNSLIEDSTQMPIPAKPFAFLGLGPCFVDGVFGSGLYSASDLRLAKKFVNPETQQEEELSGGISNSFLWVDGSIYTKNRPRDSMIVCTGDIGFGGMASKSLIIAGGRIKQMMPDDLLKKYGVVLRSADTEIIKLFKLYSTSECGLEVEERDKAATVRAAAAGQAFAAGGGRVGDVVLAINGREVQAPIDVRRFLCRACVANGEAVFKVRRGMEITYFAVKVPK